MRLTRPPHLLLLLLFLPLLLLAFDPSSAHEDGDDVIVVTEEDVQRYLREHGDGGAEDIDDAAKAAAATDGGGGVEEEEPDILYMPTGEAGEERRSVAGGSLERGDGAARRRPRPAAPPLLSDEEEMSPHLPDYLACDACLAVAHQAQVAYAAAHHRHDAPGGAERRLSEADLADGADRLCRPENFAEYGLAEYGGRHALKGPGLSPDLGEGATALVGGRWALRLATACEEIVGAFEDDLAEPYRQWRLSKDLSDYLCRYLDSVRVCASETGFFFLVHFEVMSAVHFPFRTKYCISDIFCLWHDIARRVFHKYLRTKIACEMNWTINEDRA